MTDRIEGSGTPVGDKSPELLWEPSDAAVANSQLTAFTAWLADETGNGFTNYTALSR